MGLPHACCPPAYDSAVLQSNAHGDLSAFVQAMEAGRPSDAATADDGARMQPAAGNEPAQPMGQPSEGNTEQPADAALTGSGDDASGQLAETGKPSGEGAETAEALSGGAQANAEQADPFGLEELIEPPPARVPPAPREEQPPGRDRTAGEAAAAATEGVWVGQARHIRRTPLLLESTWLIRPLRVARMRAPTLQAARLAIHLATPSCYRAGAAAEEAGRAAGQPRVPEEPVY